MSRPPEALPALIAAGKAHPEAHDDIIVALSAYGDAELSVHTEALADLLDRKTAQSKAAQHAERRLRSLWTLAEPRHPNSL